VTFNGQFSANGSRLSWPVSVWWLHETCRPMNYV